MDTSPHPQVSDLILARIPPPRPVGGAKVVGSSKGPREHDTSHAQRLKTSTSTRTRLRSRTAAAVPPARPTTPPPALVGLGTFTLTAPGGILYERKHWSHLPDPQEAFAHCRSHGLFSPRPFRLKQPTDPSTLACVLTLAAACCVHIRIDPVHLLTPLCTDPRFFDLDSAALIARTEGLRTPRRWTNRHVALLLQHLSFHRAHPQATALARAAGYSATGIGVSPESLCIDFTKADHQEGTRE